MLSPIQVLLRSAVNINEFNEQVVHRWIQHQPADIQDYLEQYGQVSYRFNEIFIQFANDDFAAVLLCQQERLNCCPGMSMLQVTIRSNLGSDTQNNAPSLDRLNIQVQKAC